MTTPRMEATLWSKTPTRAYMLVDLEMVALTSMQEALMLLTRPDGMRMALHLNTAGIDQLAKDLATIKRRFKAAQKEPTDAL